MRKWVRRTIMRAGYLWEVGRKWRKAKKPGRKKREVYIGYNKPGGRKAHYLYKHYQRKVCIGKFEKIKK